jgi:hypothetical protein
MSSGEYELANCVNENGSNQQVWREAPQKPSKEEQTSQGFLLNSLIRKVKAKRRASSHNKIPSYQSTSPTCTSHFDHVFDFADKEEAPPTTNVFGAAHIMPPTPCDPEPTPEDQEPRIPPSTINQFFSEDILGSFYISWQIPSPGGNTHLVSYDIRVKDKDAPGWSYVEKSFSISNSEILLEGPSHSLYVDPLVWSLSPRHTYEFFVRAVNSAGVKSDYGKGIFVYKKKRN